MSDFPVRRFLEPGRPMSGKELRDVSGIEELSLWKQCRLDPEILTVIAGMRYLRLDRHVEGFARLSPSIKREFLTYTACGWKKDTESIQQKARYLARDTKRISRQKLQFAQETAVKIVDALDFRDQVRKHVCFIIAGDIVYDMAHLEPRPEKSTGRLVKGSDLDIIIVADDDFPPALLKQLDEAVYHEKYMCLVKPDIREEIDYVLKDMRKTRNQLQFGRFEHMVASKILWEGRFLYGSREIFKRIQFLGDKFHIPEKMKRMLQKARKNRKEAEGFLLKGTGQISNEESYKLFYTREEAEEIF